MMYSASASSPWRTITEPGGYDSRRRCAEATPSWSRSNVASARRTYSFTTVPSATTTVRVARAARSLSCVTMSTVFPLATSCSKRSIMDAAVPESRLPVGSSATRSGASVASARAIATRCCSPPETAAGSFFAFSASPTRSSSSSARARRSCGVHRRQNSMGSTTLSSNEIVGSSWKNWKTTPTDRPRHCAVAPSLRSCTAVPSIQTSPLDGRSMPVIMLTSVLLPLPDFPITATNSPAPTSRLTLLSAARLPAGVSYCLTTLSRSISGRPSTRSRIDGPGRGSYGRAVARGQPPVARL